MIEPIACLAAGFFILGLIYRLQHRRMLPRLIWPYFISDIWRYRRAPGISRLRWMIAINVAISGVIAGMIATYQLAGALEWPRHIWHGVQISAYGVGFTYVWCDHGLPEGWHTLALWFIRWVIFVSALNLFTNLTMSWEDCRRELLHAFSVNKFVGPSAKIELQRPWSYVLKTAAPFSISKVFDSLDAIQRAAGVFILGVGNAPPSGIMILSSRKGLPEKTFTLRDLPEAHSRDSFCVGLAPVPVFWDLRRKVHVGILGPTGEGKSNLARAFLSTANIAEPNTFTVIVNWRKVDWNLRSFPNVLDVRDWETTFRALSLVHDELERRETLMVNQRDSVGNPLGITDVGELADAGRFSNAVRLPRIIVVWEEFANSYDLHGDSAVYKKCLKLFRVIVGLGRKDDVHALVITTRADFKMLDAARDLFRWMAVGNFRENAGSMIFQQEIKGWNRQGSFRYELAPPYDGLGISMAPLCDLTGRDSLTEVLTLTSARLSPQAVELGQWFQRKIHQQQNNEELEKITESLVGFINKT